MISGKIEHGAEISKRLKQLYPMPTVELDYTTPFELMVASLLAKKIGRDLVDCRVPFLYRKYRGPAALSWLENKNFPNVSDVENRRIDISLPKRKR